MIVLLANIAPAADMTWTCPPLVTPADAIDFRDVDGLGTREFIDGAVTLGSAWFDATCPVNGTDATDACHTAAGDAVAVSVWELGLQVVIVPATGGLSRFDGEWYAYEGGDWEDSRSRDEVRLTAAWTGELSPDLSADVSLAASALAAEAYSDDVEATWTATWDDGGCAWSVVETNPPPRSDGVYTWEIEVGSQTLTVTEDPTDTCTPTGGTAVLDGVTVFVEPGTWEPAGGVDADGDGWPADRGDCDDADPAAAPCQHETGCDGVDQDCDGTDSPDCDGDGHDPIEAGGDDCGESDSAIHPGATDTPCDGIDQDCDGVDSPDCDGDGHDPVEAGGDDCNEGDAAIHPGVADPSCDGIDQDCDGVDDTDGDRDGYDAECAGGDDCDDTNASNHPGARDVACDGVDQDCDGVDRQDGDADGHGSCDDCDDSDPHAYPDAPEIPGDGIDQDCDGADPEPDEPRAIPPSHACTGCDSGAARAWVGLLAVFLARRRAR